MLMCHALIKGLKCSYHIYVELLQAMQKSANLESIIYFCIINPHFAYPISFIETSLLEC